MNTSTRHVFQTLSLICASSRPLGVAEVSAAIRLPTSTAHRALVTLEDTGYIVRYRDQFKYLPGIMTRHLGQALFNRFTFGRLLYSPLREMASQTKQTLVIAARVGWYSMKIMVIEGAQDVFHARVLGQTGLLHEDLAGTALLASHPDSTVEAMRTFVEANWPGRGKELTQFDTWSAIHRARQAGYLYEPDLEAEEYGFLHRSVPNPSGRGIGTISVGTRRAGIKRRDVEPLLEKLDSIVANLGRAFETNPELAASPFDHLSPDAIVFRQYLNGAADDRRRPKRRPTRS